MKSTDTTPIETALRLQEARIAAQFELARHDSNRASQLTNIFSIAAAAAVPLAGSSFAEGNLPFALGFLVAGLIMGGAAAYCGFAGTMKHVRLVGIDKSDSSIISDIEYNTYVIYNEIL